MATPTTAATGAGNDDGKKKTTGTGKLPIADDRKRKIAADCWKTGSDAMIKQNWDYAIKMFRQAVNFVPDNLMYRQSLRGCQIRKYGDNGTGASMAGMKLMGTRGTIKKCKYQKDWPKVEQAAEDGLDVNPWDAQLNGDLGEALRELELNEVAVFAYEAAVKGDPKNKDFNRALGELYEERGEYERAVACFTRIMQIDPYDGDARSKITALQASSVMDRGGYETAQNTRDARVDKEARQKAKGAPAADGPGQSVEADLMRAIRKDEANKDNYLKLADFYKRSQQLEKSEEQLKLALEVSNGDLNIRELLEDVQLERMRQAVNVAKDAAAKNQEDAAVKKKWVDFKLELLRRELEVLARRVERYPADMKVKFELAVRYFEDKKHQQSIPLLQQARNDPRLKGDALHLLGKCFIADKQYKLAKRQFQQAVPEIKFDEAPDRFKDNYYWLGRVAEELKEKEEAIDAYNEVLAVDYTYRDTHNRLKGLEGDE